MDYDARLEQAERSVIGAAFIDQNCYEQVGLKPDAFFNLNLKVIWDCIGKLRSNGKPVDELTVADELGTMLDRVGGLPFLAELADEVPTADNVMHYADLVREGWLTRRVKLIASDVVQKSTLGIVGEDLLRTLQAGLESVMVDSGRKPPDLYSVASSEILAILGNDKPRGLPTGLGLEKLVPGGIPRDKVTVIFADAGTFKTTAKNHMLITMAEAGFKALDISLEDSTELTAHRYISRKTGVPYGRIAGGVLTDEEKGRIRALTDQELLVTKRLYTGDEVNPRISDIVQAARRILYSGGLDAVVVDYIQLLDGNGQKETLDEAVRTAQLAAKRDKISYIFLSQVKQDVIGRENPRPRLQDMLGSSAMRTGAKLAIGLFRPYSHCPVPIADSGPYGMYGRFISSEPQGDCIYPNILELHVCKNVLGPSQKAVFLLVQPETGEIISYQDQMEKYL